MRVERLSEYMASTGRSYKNHLATIRSWAKREKPKYNPADYKRKGRRLGREWGWSLLRKRTRREEYQGGRTAVYR